MGIIGEDLSILIGRITAPELENRRWHLLYKSSGLQIVRDGLYTA